MPQHTFKSVSTNSIISSDLSCISSTFDSEKSTIIPTRLVKFRSIGVNTSSFRDIGTQTQECHEPLVYKSQLNPLSAEFFPATLMHEAPVLYGPRPTDSAADTFVPLGPRPSDSVSVLLDPRSTDSFVPVMSGPRPAYSVPLGPRPSDPFVV